MNALSEESLRSRTPLLVHSPNNAPLVVLNSISLMDSLVCAIRFPAKSLSSSVLHDRYGASKNFRMGPLSSCRRLFLGGSTHPSPFRSEYPLGEMRPWGMNHHRAVDYAREP